MVHTSTPNPPKFFQLLVHIFLLQDLLNQEALSAGIWYVVIDFQLYTFLLLCFGSQAASNTATSISN